tara:strand:+ start:1424 stop:1636 length:213 start_codon:yes stop_codon:yes gene_type:complete
MGNSNSSQIEKMDCKQLSEALEKCCLEKKQKEVKNGKITESKDCPCNQLKDIYISKCDSKEDFKKQLINC